MDILNQIAAQVKLEYVMDVNYTFGQLTSLFRGTPNTPYAVLFNATSKNINFEGCPSNFIGKAMGCNPHTTQAGKANFITKPHGLISNGTIMVRVNGNEIGTLFEGYFYSYAKGAFEGKGDVNDWKKQCA